MKRLGIPFKVIIWLLFPITATIVFFIWKKKKDHVSDNEIYKAIANQQKEAMEYFGTDEEQLFSSIKDLTGEELKRVYHAFGTKGYSAGGWFPIGKQMDLFGWYASELNEKERNNLRSIWNKSGLNITF